MKKTIATLVALAFAAASGVALAEAPKADKSAQKTDKQAQSDMRKAVKQGVKPKSSGQNGGSKSGGNQHK